MQYTASFFLTAVRLFTPFIYVFFLYYADLYTSWYARLFLGILFLLIALTDFFDGYYARKYKQETQLGTILDPLADKVLTTSLLITLVALQKVYFFWAFILIVRDIVVNTFRYNTFFSKVPFTVSWWGKSKTFCMCMYIFCVIVRPWPSSVMIFVEHFLLAATLATSLWSAYCYITTALLLFTKE